MKKWDYGITGSGSERTFTPMSDRAKKKNSDPVTFKDVAGALEFMKTSEAEGYRFSGAELVDKNRKRAKYGYFVKLPNGQLAQSPNVNWGPFDCAYEAGDSLGIKDGKEGIVLNVVKGKMAELAGVDVMIVVEEHPVKSAGNA
jgi:hypothetical protein